MGRIRTLKPDFFRSRSLARCTLPARMTFQGLWCEADDHGRGIADPRLIKGAVWPLDDDIDVVAVKDHVAELDQTDHIRLYEVNGEHYYEIVEWEKHQAAAYRRGDPVYPLPPAALPEPNVPHADACEKVQAAHESVLEGKGTGKGREQGTGKPPSAALALVVPETSFDDFWAEYPRRNGARSGKQQAQKQWAKLSESDRKAALAVLPRYAAGSGGFPKDPERYLRDRLWEDWADWQPPIESAPRPKSWDGLARVLEAREGAS